MPDLNFAPARFKFPRSRTENLIVCKKAEKTEYGQFMEFETLTMVPIDLEAVLPEKMSERESTALKNAVVAIDKAAAKGIFHKNTAARKVSRLSKAVNKMA